MKRHHPLILLPFPPSCCCQACNAELELLCYMITASPVSPSDVGTTVCPACKDVVVAEPYNCTVVLNRSMGLALPPLIQYSRVMFGGFQK